MYNQNEFQSSAIKMMKQEQHELTDAEIIRTLELVEKASMLNRQKFEEKGSEANIEDWIPHPDTVKTITSLIISPLDFDRVLDRFIDFAKEREFPITPTLDAKFKSHVKFMIESGEVTKRDAPF